MSKNGPWSLKKGWEFKRVYRHGRIAVTKNIVFYYLSNQLEKNRVGFSISKKVGKSVQRHRIKRLYLEALRLLQEQLVQGCDFVVVARKAAVTVTFLQAREELYNICRKKKLLKPVPSEDILP